MVRSESIDAQNPSQDEIQKLVNIYSQGQLQSTITEASNLLTRFPHSVILYNIVGAANQGLSNLEEAIEAYKKAIILKPDYPKAYNNIGSSHQRKGRYGEAIKAFNKAIFLKPDYAEAHQNLAYTLINEGKLKEGLDEYEWRWKTAKNKDKHRHFVQPMWDGKQSLSGKRILLWCEQGVGDTIMWASRLSLVASKAEHCILECQPKLVPLLKRSFPNVEVKAEDRSLDQQRDDFDYHLPMGSLYKNFIKELSLNDKTDAYLVPDPSRVDYWKERLKSLGNGPFIGISWKSAHMGALRLPNYASITELSPIITIPNLTFINLQYVDFKEDLNIIKNEFGIDVHNFDDLDHFNNIDDVAALCSALDMVVSTKTTVPLISAAVGTSTKLANWKQSSWNNIFMNPIGPLVDIFERDTWEPWENVFKLIEEDILKL